MSSRTGLASGAVKTGGRKQKQPPEPDYIAILAHNVRAARESAGMLQFELAERIGLNQQRVSLIEAGKQNVTLKTIVALATALGLAPADLLSGSGLRGER